MEKEIQQEIIFDEPKEKIEDEYKKLFGVNPEIYFLTEDEIKAALADPEEEKMRLRQLAIDENHEEIDSMYGR